MLPRSRVEQRSPRRRSRRDGARPRRRQPCSSAPLPRHDEPTDLAAAPTELGGALQPAFPLCGRFQSSKGKRTKVTDGPFAESKELIAGYWIIDVKSKEEAIEWAKRAPMEPSPEFGDEEPVIEVRPFFELEEFGDGPAIDRARE